MVTPLRAHAQGTFLNTGAPGAFLTPEGRSTTLIASPETRFVLFGRIGGRTLPRREMRKGSTPPNPGDGSGGADEGGRLRQVRLA